MDKRFSLITVAAAAFALLGVGCTPTANVPTGISPVIAPGVGGATPPLQQVPASVDLPIADYAARRTVKIFGQLVNDRFQGYHAADDIEYGDVAGDVPVSAVADGTVLYAGWTSGYGGLIVIAHDADGEQVSALYGHLRQSSFAVKTGDRVTRGQFLANLGTGGTTETDGERKHLHFGLYPGRALRKAGYVATKAALNTWINPQDFFARHGITLPPPHIAAGT